MIAAVVVIVNVEVRVVPVGRNDPHTSWAGTKEAVTPTGRPSTEYASFTAQELVVPPASGTAQVSVVAVEAVTVQLEPPVALRSTLPTTAPAAKLAVESVSVVPAAFAAVALPLAAGAMVRSAVRLKVLPLATVTW